MNKRLEKRDEPLKNLKCVRYADNNDLTWTHLLSVSQVTVKAMGVRNEAEKRGGPYQKVIGG